MDRATHKPKKTYLDMPLLFSHVCDLLEQSYKLCQARKSNAATVADWFRRHRTRIDAHDTGLAALLSTLLPEKRTDRVYCIQASTLEKIIGRGLMLGASRMIELASYKRPGTGLDLADCVERILFISVRFCLCKGLCGTLFWALPLMSSLVAEPCTG